jgi:hypothetical protein
MQGTSGCTNPDKDLRTEESRRLSVATSTLTHHRKYRAPSFSRTNPAQRKKKNEGKTSGEYCRALSPPKSHTDLTREA